MAAKRRQRKKPEDRLAEFLEAEEKKLAMKRCGTCSHEPTREIVSAHLDKLQMGETTISLSYVHANLLVDMGGPKNYESVKRHVRQCLKRDVRTGEPLA
jgi:hypothetical protein